MRPEARPIEFTKMATPFLRQEKVDNLQTWSLSRYKGAFLAINAWNIYSVCCHGLAGGLRCLYDKISKVLCKSLMKTHCCDTLIIVFIHIFESFLFFSFLVILVSFPQYGYIFCLIFNFRRKKYISNFGMGKHRKMAKAWTKLTSSYHKNLLEINEKPKQQKIRVPDKLISWLEKQTFPAPLRRERSAAQQIQ